MSDVIQEEEVATAKAKTWGEIRVERQIQPAPNASTLWQPEVTVPMPFPSVVEARSWIEANGKDGQTYRVVRQVQVVKVKAQNIRKVELEAA